MYFYLFILLSIGTFLDNKNIPYASLLCYIIIYNIYFEYNFMFLHIPNEIYLGITIIKFDIEKS